MSLQRVAIVTPRFWPLIDDRSTHLLRLAEALIAAGQDVIVVTPRWKRTWPEEMHVGTVPLVRLRGSAAGGFRTLRWMYSLAGWLREARPDAAIVSGLKHEAYVTLRAKPGSPRACVLLAGEDDLPWQRTATLGSRVAEHCRAAPCIAAPTHAVRDELASANYPAEHIHVVSRGTLAWPPPSPQRRDAARAALAAVNYDLATTASARVALAVGRLDAAHQFGDLVRAWRIVTARHPETRLWIVGDGPERERLYRQIGDLDQRFRAMLPGTFERTDELLDACDMLLVPGAHRAPPLALLDAQAAGLPVIAADSAAARQCITTGETGILYPCGDGKSLAAAILDLIDNPARAVALAAAARAISPARPTPEDEAAMYLELIRELR
jgi:glycosyltransferase involved in cell wall biosynthesis